MPKIIAFNRTLVIQKSTKVFYDKGYTLTSMQDIVDATGLNRSSIYNSFGSKLNLFVLCLKENQKKILRDIQQIIIKSNNPTNAFQEIFKLAIHPNNRVAFVNKTISELSNQDTIVNDFLQNYQDYILQLFKDLIAKGQNIGSINNSKSSHQYAIYLFVTFNGLQFASNLMTDVNDLNNVIYTTLSILQ